MRELEDIIQEIKREKEELLHQNKQKDQDILRNELKLKELTSSKDKMIELHSQEKEEWKEKFGNI